MEQVGPVYLRCFGSQETRLGLTQTRNIPSRCGLPPSLQIGETGSQPTSVAASEGRSDTAGRAAPRPHGHRGATPAPWQAWSSSVDTTSSEQAASRQRQGNSELGSGGVGMGSSGPAWAGACAGVLGASTEGEQRARRRHPHLHSCKEWRRRLGARAGGAAALGRGGPAVHRRRGEAWRRASGAWSGTVSSVAEKEEEEDDKPLERRDHKVVQERVSLSVGLRTSGHL